MTFSTHLAYEGIFLIKVLVSIFQEELRVLSKELNGTLALAIQQLHQRFVTERTLTREWSAATRTISCPAASRAPAKCKTLVERLRDSWQHLLRDRATRSLTFNDEQFHLLEKIKVRKS